MGRFARSWRLMKQSYRVLMQDKVLMILPILSGICILLVSFSFVLGLGFVDELTGADTGAAAASEVPAETDVGAAEGEGDWTVYLPMLGWYVIVYTIGFFFQAAVVAGASQRLAGGDPTLGSALGAAFQRFGTIVVWGVVAATVGMLIRVIQDRSEIVGKIVMAIVGVAWTLATFFMVPVIVLEDMGVGASFKKSWGTFKETWGETVVGNFGLGLIQFLVLLPVLVLAGWLLANDWILAGITVGVVGIAVVAIFFSALQGVWLASLYRYATVGEAPAGFDPELFQQAFRQKKTKK